MAQSLLTKPMLSFQTAALASLPFSLPFLRRNTRIRLSNSLFSSLASTCSVDHSPPVRSKYGGIQLEETVEAGSEKSRLDAWIASRMHDVSRARIQSSIRSGLVTVNGRAVDKVQSSLLFLELIGFNLVSIICLHFLLRRFHILSREEIL